MEDLYAILGLDPGSSQESIKLAFRRLARENHPDRKAHLNPAAQVEASGRMAELNRAYAVLCDPRRRRTYDEQLRTFQAVTTSVMTAEPPREKGTNSRGAAKSSMRVRPGAEVGSSVVLEFSAHKRQELVASRKLFHWKERQIEGFEWALQAGNWSAHYCVAFRSFATVNLPETKKFTNYAALAVEKHRSMLRRNHFLFLLAFQQLLDPEKVAAQCQQFAASGSGKPLSWFAWIALLDVTHGRSLLCGEHPRNKQFNELLQNLQLRRS